MEEDLLPRVLVVSHQCFSSTTAMGKTMASFFDCWHGHGVAQLFFRSETPDADCCSEYFRITDFDILQNALTGHGRLPDGRLNGTGGSDAIDRTDQTRSPFVSWAYCIGEHRWPAMNLARDFVWQRKRWDTGHLQEWLDYVDPEVVMLVPGEYRFAYEIACRIARKRRIPLIIYYTDDYYGKQPSLSPLYWLMHSLLMCTARRTIMYSSCLLTVSDRMAEEYERRFSRPCYVLRHSVDAREPLCVPPPGPQEVVRLSYIGNLHSNRWRSIAVLARALSQYVTAGGHRAELSIFSRQKPSLPVLNAISIDGISRYAGSLDADGVCAEQQRADVLVHVESFDRRSRHYTRLSVSTKIPEYMTSGKCILAFGPSEVASIDYVRRHGMGIVATAKRQLPDALKRAIEDAGLRTQMGMRARAVAERNHDRRANAQFLANMMRAVVADPTPHDYSHVRPRGDL